MTDKLDIINYMLSVVDESPVSDPASDHPTVQSALVVLNRVSKQVQTRGWWFNKEYNLNLSPDAQGYIILPSNTLKADPVDVNSVLVKRGAKLYDPSTHSFAIGVATLVNVVVQLNIEDLPETAALYIQAKSAYDFYVNDNGDEQKCARLKLECIDTRAALNAEQLQASNVTAMESPTVAKLRAGIQQGYSSGNPTWPGGR